MYSKVVCLALLVLACVSLPRAFASEQETVAPFGENVSAGSIARKLKQEVVQPEGNVFAELAYDYGYGHGHKHGCRNIGSVCSHQSQCCGSGRCIQGKYTTSHTCCAKGLKALGESCIVGGVYTPSICCSGVCDTVGAADVCVPL